MMRKVVVTGAAGLVGQNFVAHLKRRNDVAITGIDKHRNNITLFRRIHPEVEIIEADLAEPGEWINAFAGADTVVISQAQISGLHEAEFEANNVVATRHILDAVRARGVPYFVGISTSAVNSAADDVYTRTKSAQENLFDSSSIPHVVLRPTLMFGWFDRKHLGWLARFMQRTPVFPIPGDGQFVRQPLYVGDFVAVIMACIERRTEGVYDISGLEQVSYKELIRAIHDIVKPKARIVHIPYALFWGLLWLYARFDRNPPFTTHQLEALVIHETFPVINWPNIFGVKPTPLRYALEETYLHPDYSRIVLEF